MSSTPSIIDVLIVIDADTLIADYPGGTPANPMSVDQKLIYMMVRQDNGVFGEGTKELKIRAQTEDQLRWRETTTTLNSVYFGLMYKFFTLRGSELLSAPEALVATVKTPLPDPDNPLVPRTQEIKSYFWAATILQPGKTTYAFQFAILDRHNNPLGYYTWDPFISITE